MSFDHCMSGLLNPERGGGAMGLIAGARWRGWNWRLALALAASVVCPAATIQVATDEQGVLFSEGAVPVLFYQRAPRSIDGRFTRNHYVHPLWDLEGNVLTEDGPPDHLHQRGVYWAWHQVFCEGRPLGDAWECRRFQWEVTGLRVEAIEGEAQSLVAGVLWQSPDLLDDRGEPRPVVEERARITVWPRSEGRRNIDFDLAFTALRDGVELGGSDDEKGYGGFSLRIVCPEDLTFTSTTGRVVPENEAIRAGPAMDFAGTVGSGPCSGVAVLVHPANPAPINRWILRASKSMQNAVFPGRERVGLPEEGGLRLRYRLVLHQGALSAADLSRLLTEYSVSVPR